jgi:hypothetical protein
MNRGRVVLGCLVSLVALATGCSLITSLDGLSGGAPTQDGGDGGAILPDAAADTGPGVDAAADAFVVTKPRVWRQLSVPGPPAVHSARMAYDEMRKKTILYGGRGPATTTDTWEWDGVAWTKGTTSANPGARNSAGLAYDSTRGVVMLYGGSDGTPDPWQLDATGWKSSGTSPTSPDVRYSSAMAFDRARGVMVVFGGIHFGAMGTNNGETWEWSSSTGFVNRNPPLSPPARHANVLVYDSARSRVIAYGGNGEGSLGDTWEWDGTSWMQRTPALSPPPRRGACAAFDAARKATVVFGGRPPDTNVKGLNDTWLWDGTTWTKGPDGPQGRSSCAMAYDSAHDQIVMFGGSPGHVGMMPPASVNDTWVFE